MLRGKRSNSVVAVDGSNRYEFAIAVASRVSITCRIVLLVHRVATVVDVTVTSTVAGRDDDKDSCSVGGVDCAVHGLGVLVSAQAHVDDLRAFGHRPGDAGRDAIGRTVPVGPENLHRHDGDGPVASDAGHADAVIGLGCNDPGNVSAVAVIVVGSGRTAAVRLRHADTRVASSPCLLCGKPV